MAFSTAETVRRTPERRGGLAAASELGNDAVTPLFAAVIEATEEAIYNSMLTATTMRSVDAATGRPVMVEAIDIAEVRRVLATHRLGG